MMLLAPSAAPPSKGIETQSAVFKPALRERTARRLDAHKLNPKHQILYSKPNGLLPQDPLPFTPFGNRRSHQDPCFKRMLQHRDAIPLASKALTTLALAHALARAGTEHNNELSSPEP